MKHKLLTALLTLVCGVCLAIGLSACGNSTSTTDWNNGIFTVEAAYAEAQGQGYSGTLEEFIASISGSDGTDGEDGSVWYTGSGAPASTTGKDGDMYLDTATYDIYQMTDGSWAKVGNIKGADGEDGATGATGASGSTGATGADGEDGSVWYTGSGAPSSTTGKDGDMYLDTTTYDIYQMTNGSWAKVGNIKGADGEDGATGATGATGSTGATGATGATGEAGADGEDGSVWYTGSGAPASITGKDGDMYLDTATYDIYQMTDGSWAKIGNIKGADGEDGATGASGSTGATGATGADGEDGSVWYTGSGAPASTTGKDGDMYLDTATYDIYQMTDGSWAKVGNIKGADGTGSEGSTATNVTVNFDLNYDTDEEIESVTVTKGDSIADLAEPARDGYAFIGWFTGTGVNAGQVTDVTPISRDMTLYARWTKTYNFDLESYDTEAYISEEVSIHGMYGDNLPYDGYNLISLKVEFDGVIYTDPVTVSAGSSNAAVLGDFLVCYMIENDYDGEFYGSIFFYKAGEYTVTLVYGYSETSFTVNIKDYEVDSDTSFCYSYYEDTYNWNYFYDDEISISTYSDNLDYADLELNFEYVSTDSTATISVNDTVVKNIDSLIYIDDTYAYSWSLGDIFLYIDLYSLIGDQIGEYKIIISISGNNGEATLTVNYTIEQYTVEGEIATEGFYYYHNWNETTIDDGSISVCCEYIEYDYLYYYLTNVPSNADIVIKINSSEITDYNYEWNLGSAYIYINLSNLTQNQVGEYVLVVTVTTENNDTLTDTLNYTITKLEGDIQIDHITFCQAGGSYTEYSNNDNITLNIDNGAFDYDIHLSFNLSNISSDASVSVKINKNSCDYNYDMYFGECSVYVYLYSYINNQAGTYVITLTASSDISETITATVTLIIEEASTSD